MEAAEFEKFILNLEKDEISKRLDEQKKEYKKQNEKLDKPALDKVKSQVNTQVITNWIDRYFFQDLAKITHYVPVDGDKTLFDFITVPFSGRTNLKQAFDKNLLKLQEYIEKHYSNKYVEWQAQLAKLDSEVISLYDFFKTSLGKKKEVVTTKTVADLIDELSVKAQSGTVATHVGKFSHPLVKGPNLFVHKSSAVDGYIRTGNVNTEADLHINATYLVVYGFLSLKVNGVSLLNHILADNTAIWSRFTHDQTLQKRWHNRFSQCCASQNEQTNHLIKQVYFPVDKDQYHLLSIITSSSMAFEVKERIDHFRYNDEGILARRAEKSGQLFEKGYGYVPNVTRQRFGGDHPKNISALNNKHQDVLLLDGSPPQFTTKKTRNFVFKPMSNAFLGQVSATQFRFHFFLLHRVIAANNVPSINERTKIMTEGAALNNRFMGDVNRATNGKLEDGIQPHHLKLYMRFIYEDILDTLIQTVWQQRMTIAQDEALLAVAKTKTDSLDLLVLPDIKKTEETEGVEARRKRKEDDKWFLTFSEDAYKFIAIGYETLVSGAISFHEGDEHYEQLLKAIKQTKGALL